MGYEKEEGEEEVELKLRKLRTDVRPFPQFSERENIALPSSHSAASVRCHDLKNRYSAAKHVPSPLLFLHSLVYRSFFRCEKK